METNLGKNVSEKLILHFLGRGEGKIKSENNYHLLFELLL